MQAISLFEESLTPNERTILSKLDSPAAIQAFLDDLPYSTEAIYRCPLSVLRQRRGHCFDGAVFAGLIFYPIEAAHVL